MEKNKFFMFLFAMVPGMSHMYLGMMKKGVFLMSLFLAPLALIFLTRGGLEIVSCILPVVWCYSFFDTFRYKNYSKEERYHLDEEFYKAFRIFCLEEATPMLMRRRKFVGICCIFLAVYTFIYNILGYFTNFFDRIFLSFYLILSKVPTLLVVLFLLKLGIDLLRAEEDDFVAYSVKKQKDVCENETKPKKESEIKTMQDTPKEEIKKTEVEQKEEEGRNVQEEQVEINLEKGEKIVEPIFLEKRIEE